MKVKKYPKTQCLNRGKVLKSLKMLAEGNTIGPEHKSTKETVLVILEGKIIVKLPDEDYTLSTGDAKVIPAEVKHYLEIIEDTKAIHIMPVDNKINFIAG